MPQDEDRGDLSQEVFGAFQYLLMQSPVDVLAAAVRRSLPLESHARQPFEEVLWRLSPLFEPLLRQAYQQSRPCAQRASWRPLTRTHRRRLVSAAPVIRARRDNKRDGD